MRHNDILSIDITVLHETAAAWLVEDSDGHQAWVPKSYCEVRVDKDGSGTLDAPRWLIEDKERS